MRPPSRSCVRLQNKVYVRLATTDADPAFARASADAQRVPGQAAFVPQLVVVYTLFRARVTDALNGTNTAQLRIASDGVRTYAAWSFGQVDNADMIQMDAGVRTNFGGATGNGFSVSIAPNATLSNVAVPGLFVYRLDGDTVEPGTSASPSLSASPSATGPGTPAATRSASSTGTAAATSSASGTAATTPSQATTPSRSASASPSPAPAATGLRCFVTHAGGRASGCVTEPVAHAPAGRCVFNANHSSPWRGWVPVAGDAVVGDVVCHTDFCNTGPAGSGCAAVGSTTTTVNVTLRMTNVDPVAIISNASRAALLWSVASATRGTVTLEAIVNADDNSALWSRALAAATANVRVVTSVAFDHPSSAAALAASNATLGAAVLAALAAPDAPPAAAAFAGAGVTTEAVVVGAPVPVPSASPSARAGTSGNDDDDAKKRTTTGIIVGVVVGGSVLLAAVAALVVVMLRRSRGAATIAGAPAAADAAAAPKQAGDAADSEAGGPAPPMHSNPMPGAHQPKTI